MAVDSLQMARSILETAARYDDKVIQPTAFQPDVVKAANEKVEAWARVLDGKAWPTESIHAVEAFYGGKTWGKSLMPGDVIEYCSRLPFWSSPEHATFRIEQWLRWPNCHQIEDHCGIDVPTTTRGGSREATIEARLAWGRENFHALLEGLMTSPRHIPAEHNWNLERYP